MENVKYYIISDINKKKGSNMKKYGKRGSKGNKVLIIVCGSIVVIVVASLSFWYMYNKNRSIPEEVQISEMEEKTYTVIRARKGLSPGQIITESDGIETVELQEPAAGAITDIEMIKNKTVLNNIGENEVIQSEDIIDISQYYTDTDRLTEVTFMDGTIPTLLQDQITGRFVDILLFVKGDEDPVVVAKSRVMGTNGVNKALFHFTPQEDEYIREASSEGVLYLRIYLDNQQESREVTYVPNYNVNSNNH